MLNSFNDVPVAFGDVLGLAWKEFGNTSDGHLVAVAYYRSGYEPTDDPSELEWHARLLLERYKMSMDLIPLGWNQKSATRAWQAKCIRKVLPSFVFSTPRNNKYGSAVKAKLLGDGGAGLSVYIVMQRIFPPTYTSYLVRGGERQSWSWESLAHTLSLFFSSLNFLQGMTKDKSPTRIVATC
ncbi:hypothetical protein SELMODRAFT_418835 [Selaginella moellendorffii]|uniref:Glutathione synthase substrate-binding domain-containing protein n=1 Tax=Selaginella moellendorffii TaxID=88036 RepID=D8S6I9_SELML|nr:hypothetical protein SELMODRAFT_418835 [Selaginella moellendorffii]